MDRRSILKTLAELGKGIGKGSMFGLRFTSRSVKNVKAALEMKARANAVQRMALYILADQTYFGVTARIPAGPKYSAYRKSIQLARFGPQKAPKAYAVFAEPKATNRAFDTAKTVMYVRPKKNFQGKIRKEVLVLAKYSPWTAETLPFSPLKNEAVIVTRKVTKHEMQAVSKQREGDRPEWRRALTEAGMHHINQTKKLPELKTAIVQDLAFDALRLEFGYGGAKAVPHWRPAAHEAFGYIKRLLKGRSIFSKALTDPNYRAWRKWPPRVESSIKIGTLKGLRKFSKRLRVRV